METNNEKVSAAIRFLRATRDAMPRTIGDRVRISSMCEAFDIALRCKFQFAKTDAQILEREFGIDTCVGVFRPLDERHYIEACAHGGTYPAMWEAHKGMDPWIAPRVGIKTRGHGSAVIKEDYRVAPGSAVLVPIKERTEDDDTMGTTGDDRVWWCTSFKRDSMVLCRYHVNPEKPYTLWQPEDGPARRVTITRDQWHDFVDAPTGLKAQLFSRSARPV